MQKNRIYRTIAYLAVLAVSGAAIYAMFHFFGTIDLTGYRSRSEAPVSAAAAVARISEEQAADPTDPVEKAIARYRRKVSCFREENADRYRAFLSKHPQYGKSVIWRVNAGQDLSWEKDDRIPITDEEPLLVNKHYRLPKSYVPELTTVEGNYQTTPETARAYQRMKRAAARQGMDGFLITSAYRSYDYQQQLFDGYRRSRNETEKQTSMYSAYAGSSEHQTGRAIDLYTPGAAMEQFGTTPEAAWIRLNGYRYGFIVRYYASEKELTGIQDEPWHITYVGKEIAEAMHRADIRSLEEYLGKHPEVTGIKK